MSFCRQQRNESQQEKSKQAQQLLLHDAGEVKTDEDLPQKHSKSFCKNTFLSFYTLGRTFYHLQ